ncbi:MAG: DUF262 domain-containing protein [Bacteroidales bacterium]|nr:DUF262 domain-containing protein [Bacteroidales bacterium]
MANKINFITGETYTLAELFSGERRIIIPDLQRDYCWGDENNTKSTGEKGELVTDFVNNLLGQFDDQRNKNDKSALNLGLFYGYEVPADHIQLCDGQQRLTTLYLLLGMINKETVENKDNQFTEGKFRRHLISDFEYKQDDKEPYLNYAIRESSLYFLSDLVCKFFIGNTDKVECIKSADWYFDDYNLDPSIQSMLKALAKIDNIFADKGTDYLSEFGDWLLNKVTFLYFDMENRKNGEETFVVINTTGESLSSTQNLKPLVIQEKNDQFDNTSFSIKSIGKTKGIDQCWEEIETWFWKNRKGENDTADAGFAEFLRWISIIEQVDINVPEENKTDSIKKLIQVILQGEKCDFPYKKISFEKIYNYWKALKWINENDNFKFVDDYLSPKVNEKVNERNAIGQNDCFVLLPLLRYVYKNISTIESDPNKQRNGKRIYEFFQNLIRIDNVSKAVNTLVGDAIKIIDLLKDGDIVSLIDESVDISNISKQILSDEELCKLEILKSCSLNRNDVEDAFWKAQSHLIWSGEIQPIIGWAKENENFNIEKFKEYSSKFSQVFHDNLEYAELDITRRALLAMRLKDYPRHFGSNTNYSFAWEYSDWQTLINDNIEKFKEFFDKLDKADIYKGQQYIIDNFEGGDWGDFVQNKELLEYCEGKNIQWWGENLKWVMLKKQKASGDHANVESYKKYLELKDVEELNKQHYLWFYSKEGSCIAIDKDKSLNSWVLDIAYFSGDSFCIYLKHRNSEKTNILFKDISSKFGLIWNQDTNSYKKEVKSNNVKSTLIEIIKDLEM